MYPVTLMPSNWVTSQVVFFEYENPFDKTERIGFNAAGYSVELLAVMTGHQPTISLIVTRFTQSEEIDSISYLHPLT